MIRRIRRRPSPSAGSRRNSAGVSLLGVALQLGLVGSLGVMTMSAVGLAHSVSTTAQLGTARTAPAGGAKATGHPAVSRAQAGIKDAAAAPGTTTAAPQSHFSNPLYLPKSDNIGEPSMIADGAGNIYVAGPGSIGSGQQTVFLWKSTDGGQDFVGPLTTANLAGDDSPLGGGDADLAADKANDLFAVDLWLGNSDMEVSTDGASTWTGIPWGHLTPGDDRPWLTYDPLNDALYAVWDGVDGVHVGKALIRHYAPTNVGGVNAQPLVSLEFVQDVIVVPESAVGSGTAVDGTPIRECLCPTGNIAIDPQGNLWFAFSRQSGPGIGGGVGIAESTDGGLQWTTSSIPGSGHGNVPTEVGLNFPFMRSDGKGNLYVVWSEPVPVGLGEAVQVPEAFYSWRGASDTAWHQPVQLSHALGGAYFPTLAVVSPGVVDIAWYNETLSVSQINAAQGVQIATYDIDIAQSADATSGAHFTVDTAYPGIYVGAAGLPPRFPGFGDFFSMIIDRAGMADIVSDVDVGQNQYQLMFLHQVAPLNGPVSVSVSSSPQCPAGLTGTPPNCAYQAACPPGTTGTFPICQIPSGAGPGAANAASAYGSSTPAGGAATGGGPPGSGQQTRAPAQIDAAERATVARIHPPLEGNGTSASLALLVAGILLGSLCAVALLAKVRTS